MSFWHDAISRVRHRKAYLIANLMSLLVKARLHVKSVLKVASVYATHHEKWTKTSTDVMRPFRKKEQGYMYM